MRGVRVCFFFSNVQTAAIREEWFLKEKITNIERGLGFDELENVVSELLSPYSEGASDDKRKYC